jgi:hypothetical protein
MPVAFLLCSGCDRRLGELYPAPDGGLGRIERVNRRAGPPDDPVRFGCSDRCGIRYAVPRRALDALVRRIGVGRAARVRLPVRGRRNGRAPTLERRAAARARG